MDRPGEEMEQAGENRFYILVLERDLKVGPFIESSFSKET